MWLQRYIIVKGNISVNNTAGAAAAPNNTNKKAIFKNCSPFTNCISKINNTQIDNAEYTDIVMPMYNLIEYSDNYSKASGSLWQYYKDVPDVDEDGDIFIFDGTNDTDSLNFKSKIIGKANNDGDIENVEVMVPLKHLRAIFGELLKSLWLIVKLNLFWHGLKNCVIISTKIANQSPTFTITETNLYVPVVTLSTQDHAKLLPQLKSGFKRINIYNKYLAGINIYQNQNY